MAVGYCHTAIVLRPAAWDTHIYNKVFLFPKLTRIFTRAVMP